MVLPLLFGIIIIVIVAFVALKILKNVVLGTVLIGLTLFASYLILGSLPDLKAVPIIGQFIPELPSSTGKIITIIKNFAYSLDILTVIKDTSGNLLISVANTGKLSISDFKVLVDGEESQIINFPKDPLKSGENTILQVNWDKQFSELVIQTKQTNSTFSR